MGRKPTKTTQASREPFDEHLAETMGKRIRDLYEERGWSQQELAWRANLSITKVSRIVTGDQGMSAHILLRLARAFDVSADYLLGLTEKQKPSS